MSGNIRNPLDSTPRGPRRKYDLNWLYPATAATGSHELAPPAKASEGVAAGESYDVSSGSRLRTSTADAAHRIRSSADLRIARKGSKNVCE
jgi:hypothetical protein